jgi:hypothetical protein
MGRSNQGLAGAMVPGILGGHAVFVIVIRCLLQGCAQGVSALLHTQRGYTYGS